MNQNPFGGKRAVEVLDRGLGGNPTAATTPMAPYTMGQFQPGGQAQPAQGDIGPMLSGRAGAALLPPRDDDADQVVAAQSK